MMPYRITPQSAEGLIKSFIAITVAVIISFTGISAPLGAYYEGAGGPAAADLIKTSGGYVVLLSNNGKISVAKLDEKGAARGAYTYDFEEALPVRVMEGQDGSLFFLWKSRKDNNSYITSIDGSGNIKRIRNFIRKRFYWKFNPDDMIACDYGFAMAGSETGQGNDTVYANNNVVFFGKDLKILKRGIFDRGGFPRKIIRAGENYAVIRTGGNSGFVHFMAVSVFGPDAVKISDTDLYWHDKNYAYRNAVMVPGGSLAIIGDFNGTAKLTILDEKYLLKNEYILRYGNKSVRPEGGAYLDRNKLIFSCHDGVYSADIEDGSVAKTAGIPRFQVSAPAGDGKTALAGVDENGRAFFCVIGVDGKKQGRAAVFDIDGRDISIPDIEEAVSNKEDAKCESQWKEIDGNEKPVPEWVEDITGVVNMVADAYADKDPEPAIALLNRDIGLFFSAQRYNSNSEPYDARYTYEEAVKFLKGGFEENARFSAAGSMVKGRLQVSPSRDYYGVKEVSGGKVYANMLYDPWFHNRYFTDDSVPVPAWRERIIGKIKKEVPGRYMLDDFIVVPVSAWMDVPGKPGYKTSRGWELIFMKEETKWYLAGLRAEEAK